MAPPHQQRQRHTGDGHDHRRSRVGRLRLSRRAAGEPDGERPIGDQPRQARREEAADRSPDVPGLARGEQRRRGQDVTKEAVVEGVGKQEQRAEDADPQQNPWTHAAREDQQRDHRYHNGDNQDQPIRDRRRLQQGDVREDQRLDGERRGTPEDVPDRRPKALRHKRRAARIGGGAGLQPCGVSPPQRIESPTRDQQRQRREYPRRRRHDNDERAPLARGDLRKPGHALLHHVPLQPVEARNARRENPSLQTDGGARREWRNAKRRADPVLVRDGPRSVQEFPRYQPQPVIGKVDARWIPCSRADIGQRDGDGDFLARLQQPR